MQHITIIIPTRHSVTPPEEGMGEVIYDEGRGKKWALHKGIAAATSEWVWLTDDDVVLPDVTEEQLLAVAGDADMVILPLRMRMSERKSLLERLQVAEYEVLQALTIWSASRGHAVMCSGANLLVKREKWLEAYEDLHPEIPSGDDMFLLESFKRRGQKITTCSFCAEIEAVAEWKPFWRQRMRWAGKAAKYTDRDIRLCGWIVAVLGMLQILCPALVLLYWLTLLASLKGRLRSSAWLLLLLGMLYPYYMLVCLIGGMKNQKRW